MPPHFAVEIRYKNHATAHQASFYPGVKRIGGLWFGFRRTSLEQIQSLRVVIKHPFDESLNSLGPDFDFALDLTVRKQDPLPEELK